MSVEKEPFLPTSAIEITTINAHSVAQTSALAKNLTSRERPGLFVWSCAQMRTLFAQSQKAALSA